MERRTEVKMSPPHRQLPTALSPTRRRPAKSRGLDALVVLIAGDRSNVAVLAARLRTYRAVVIEISNATLALAYLERHSVDVVLVDLGMPGEDGWWLAQQVRAVQKLDNVPMYAFGGRDQEPPDAACGFVGYCAKPIGVLELFAIRCDSSARRAV
jgi:CheY-like chemotaxis protein